MTDWFTSMLANPEELDPELAEALVDFGELTAIKQHPLVIKHPLVNDPMYMEVMNPRYNALLRLKREQLSVARLEKNWHRFVFLHEKPWRSNALLEIADDMGDTEYWRLVRNVWLTSENIWEWGDDIEALLLSDRPCQYALMEPEDRELWDSLDDEFEVHRGHQSHNEYGWSWTLLPEKAIWFARRYATEGFISTAIVQKVDIVAVFVGMGENEVVIDPSKVEVSRKRRIIG